MIITQEQFNEVIDLLGDAASAEANFRVIPSKYSNVIAQKESKEAFERYIQAVKNLYGKETYPAVYDNAYQNKSLSSTSSSTHSGSNTKSKEKLSFSINIRDIKKQMNQDFTSDDDIESTQHLHYTGNYCNFDVPILSDDGLIKLNIKRNPDTIQSYPAMVYSEPDTNPGLFTMIMSHPITLALSAILLLVGLGMIASGMGITPGAYVAGAGALLLTGYAATKFGFFSGSSDSKVDANAGAEPTPV
ncbi:MAG: hypothetical protein K0U37_02390 [Gammaproteobacteria bacterium]|nr:hypothetical protein [Gammaproteobacteria bacterium]